MNYRGYVFCTFQFEAIHQYPGCKNDEVEFLKYPHRHIFHVKAWAEIHHSDRDVEFITLKRKLSVYCKYSIGDNAGSRSCEDIAIDLLESFEELQAVSVSEDGENGAYMTRKEESNGF